MGRFRVGDQVKLVRHDPIHENFGIHQDEFGYFVGAIRDLDDYPRHEPCYIVYGQGRHEDKYYIFESMLDPYPNEPPL